MDIIMMTAAHKPYRMPNDPMYLPVQVGAAGKETIEGYTRDDTGENISVKNPSYCELTGLYWLWKNRSADAAGLVHYRRYFTGSDKGDKWARIIGRTEMEWMLQKAPVLLPKKRRYWIESTYDQYVHAHHAQDLDVTRQILEERYPEYTAAFDKVMKKTSGHRFNMFVMMWDQLDAYCTWLFDVLAELENRLDTSDYDAYNARVYGFVAERLLDVWIITNDIKYEELPYEFMEKQNWIKKGGAFLMRKFRGGADR